ncbi:unnamed protein product, partial [Ectocarpus sp. 8 AP-2014]
PHTPRSFCQAESGPPAPVCPGRTEERHKKEETNTAAGPAPIRNTKKALRAKKGTLGNAHATNAHATRGSFNTSCCCRGLCETCPRTNGSLPLLAPSALCRDQLAVEIMVALKAAGGSSNESYHDPITKLKGKPASTFGDTKSHTPTLTEKSQELQSSTTAQ